MRHRKHTFKIGRSGAHRKALLANQVCSLITEGEIKTTVTKAKETRRIADKMVTLGKKGELHHRRLAISKLRDETAVAQLFAEIAPKFSNRDGGYTRIIRVGTRRGDAAEMCILQWVESENKPKPSKKKAKKEEAKVEDKAAEEVKEEPKAETEDKKEEAKEEKAPKEEAKKEEAKAKTEAKVEKAEEKAEAPKEEKKKEEKAKK
jgi:large subunit ribosomal protein L17